MEYSGGGLTFGITLYHIRALCENVMEGGGGYTLGQIAEMTPDQIILRLAKLDSILGSNRTVRQDPAVVMAMMDERGYIKGRDAEGNLIYKRIMGKSLVSRMREQKQREAEEAEQLARKRDRKARGERKKKR